MQYKYLKLGDVIPFGAEFRMADWPSNSWRKSDGEGLIWDGINIGQKDNEYRVKINEVIITESGDIEYV